MPVASLTQPRRIVDCGSNAGYAAIFLLERFKEAELLGIEPDGENLELAIRNTALYGKRRRLIRGAVWGRTGRVAPQAGEFRDGREWSIQVAEPESDSQPTVPAYAMSDLFAEAQFETVDLVKMDVEGAESEIFGSRNMEWLTRVSALSVEFHSDESEALFRRALAGEEWNISASGELTMAVRVASQRREDIGRT